MQYKVKKTFIICWFEVRKFLKYFVHNLLVNIVRFKVNNFFERLEDRIKGIENQNLAADVAAGSVAVADVLEGICKPKVKS